MKHTFLGIDLGTSAMKLVLMDSNKKVLEQITEHYNAAQSDDGVCEIDPEIWFECMKRGMHRILHRYDGRKIRAIGITGQMHTLITVDKEGKTIRPAIMWNDTRTKDMIPELKRKIESFDGGDYLARTISTGSPAANLFWIKEHEPENLKKLDKFMIGPDYLVYRLTGVSGTDYCEASTSCLMNIYTKKWSTEMREFLGLQEEVYPTLRGSAMSAGRILPEIADEFGIDPSAKVIAGTGDNAATAVSTGCMGSCFPVISLGTSGVFMMPIAKPEKQAKGKMILCSLDNESFVYLVQGVVQSNGNTFDWWTKDIMEGRDFDEFTNCLNVNKLSYNQLLFYPHLWGDKTLYCDPDLRGAYIGLSTETKKEDMFYAMVEGLCFGFRELAEKMKFDLDKFGSVKVVGGGSRSPVWMQTLANVLNVRVEKMDGMIGPAFGIALLAAYSAGLIESFGQIADGNVIIEKTYEPVSDAVKQCDAKYQKYLRIHDGINFIINGTMK